MTNSYDKIRIVKIKEEELEKSVRAYNIEVEGNHNYFVGDSFVLVHNKVKSETGTVFYEDEEEYYKFKKNDISDQVVEDYAQYLKDKRYKKISNESKLGIGKVNDFSDLGKATTVDDLLSRIPKDAKIKTFKPEIGRIEEGIIYEWNADGRKMLVRIHGKDPLAPVGSNAANGWVARIQKGSNYYDPVLGDYVPRNVHKPSSQYYDPIKANNTHFEIDVIKKN